MLSIDSTIQYLKGISAKKAILFAKLGINTLYDLISFFPTSYQNRTKNISIKELLTINTAACIFVQIGSQSEKRLSAILSVLTIEVFDGNSYGQVKFFRKISLYSKFDIFAYIKKNFIQGSFAYIYGAARVEYSSTVIIPSDYEILQTKNDEPLYFKKIIPIYNATEGLKQKFIRDFIKRSIYSYSDLYPNLFNLVPKDYALGLMPIPEAIKKIHCPDSIKEIEEARKALALQEFLVLQTSLLLSRNNLLKNNKIQQYTIKKTLLSDFKNNMTFNFTQDQKKAINDIFKDMQSKKSMNRLLMGDVGSGKTIVALSAILLAVENGYQTMILAPTEILAEQHYLTISNMLKGLNIKIDLVTSSTLNKRKEKELLLENLKNGHAQIVVGTHALIEDKIKFKNLSLIVVDEQHRFGVVQKFHALYKALTPDVLMMTATPIPRALAMTVYREIDITTIKHMPKGRIPVKTYSTDEETAYANTIKELEKGNQAYIVYPLIEESEKLELKSATKEFEKLSKGYFKNFKIALLHGKMKPQEKVLIMQKFKNKEFDILIATTIIEVGIDVPNATAIIIQHAERFGLSALHQLRGRVGRSTKQSYAYLISSSNTASTSKRLTVMTKTNDGFEVAQEDLKIRGPGELMGTVQHGFPTFKAADLVKDVDIIDLSRNIATSILSEDPYLLKQENAPIKNLVNKLSPSKINFLNIG